MGARIEPFRPGSLMAAVVASVALGVTWIALAATPAGAALINPGFETGDATGWQSYIDHCAVVGDGASEGMYYLTALVDWQFLPGVPGIGAGWHWQAGAHQTFSVPDWATWMCVDIRAEGADPAHCGVGLTHATADGLGIDIDFGATVNLERTPSVPAPNGFRRYMIDISGAAGLDNVGISVHATGSAPPTSEPPEGFIEFSVDNIQILPEPATLALVGLGGVGMLARRRRP